MSHEVVIIGRARIETGHGNMSIKKEAKVSLLDAWAVCKVVWRYLRSE